MYTYRTSMAVHLFLYIFLLAGVSFSQDKTGAQFLNIGIGARACAMGEAYSGLSDDPSAIFWNPAGLTEIGSTELLGAQNFWLLDMNSQFLGITWPSTAGYFGASVSYSSSGDIPKYENFQRIGTYSAYDAVAALAYAENFQNLFSFGLVVKGIYQKIEEEDAEGIALDIGMQRTQGENMKLALVIQNLGPGIRFIEQKDPLPLNIKTGIAYNYRMFIITCDINIPRNDDIGFNTGSEAVIKKHLAFRAGYNSDQSYTAGFGLILRKLRFDYAFIPLPDIDNSHRFTFRYLFE